MQVELRHSPSFTVARCMLAGGEPVRVEGGAMIAHSAASSSRQVAGRHHGRAETQRARRRFVLRHHLHRSPQGGWVDLAGVLPGDTVPIDVSPDQPFFLRRGSWIANSHGVEIDTQWGGMANLFGGEGGFGFRASGQGQALVSIYGAVDIIDLEDGDSVTIDTGHVVAYALDIRFQMRRAAQGRSLQSMKSGEGWVFDFWGPGRVLLQSRNPEAFGALGGAGGAQRAAARGARRPRWRARRGAAVSTEPNRLIRGLSRHHGRAAHRRARRMSPRSRCARPPASASASQNTATTQTASAAIAAQSVVAQEWVRT